MHLTFLAYFIYVIKKQGVYPSPYPRVCTLITIEQIKKSDGLIHEIIFCGNAED
jgi:hypothetical protein